MSARNSTPRRLLASKGELIRALERLRVGLPPFSATRDLSVDADRSLDRLRVLLRLPGNSVLFILGDYGAGKSHFLAILRDLALAEGYATCWLTADGYESALNHPQRFLSSLLGTLETPDGTSGYSALIARLLESSTSREAVLRASALALDGSSNLELSAKALLVELVVNGAEGDGQHETQVNSDALARILSGETLTGLGNMECYRKMAYRLLALAEQMTRLAGCGGLVIVLDEVESVFTKLWNIRSRVGAYRTLSALGLGMGQASIKVAMAVTPDAAAAMAAELRSSGAGIVAPSFEPVSRFQSALLKDDIATFRCSTLKSEQIGELLQKIRDAYCQAYPELELAEEDWQRAVESILGRMPSIRLAVRDCIDTLDRLRLISHLSAEKYARPSGAAPRFEPPTFVDDV